MQRTGDLQKNDALKSSEFEIQARICTASAYRAHPGLCCSFPQATASSH